jgi:hypothetical protein
MFFHEFDAAFMKPTRSAQQFHDVMVCQACPEMRDYFKFNASPIYGQVEASIGAFLK